MPRDGSGIYTKPSGTTAVTSTTIESSKYNQTIDDLVTDANTVRPIVAGGTAAASASAARTNLGLAIGTNVQAYDATLTSIAALGTAADKGIYSTGVDTWAEFSLTSAGRAILDDASASAQRTTLGLAIGTDVQAYDADLAALAGLSGVQGDMIYRDASQWQRLPKGTADQHLVMNAGATAPEWSSGNTFLGTLTMNSGTSKTLSSLVLTDYKFLQCYLSAVQLSSSGAIRLGGITFTGTTSSAISGFCTIELTSGCGFGLGSASGSFVSGAGMDTSYTNASTSIVFSSSGPTFSSGSIHVFGVK
jgi:hypothetical protein